MSLNKRILPLDGWRAIAALGVLWIHTWTICQNPSLTLAGINVYKLLSIFGNGVDLFFVISGFCLYLVLYNKTVNLNSYFQFIKKRWLRIAPAFYVASVVILFLKSELFQTGAIGKLFCNFLFTQNLVPGKVISDPFWSLAVEFHFYLVLPLFFILSSRIGIKKALVYTILTGMMLNLLFIADHWRYNLVTKIVHFSIGISVAYIYVNGTVLPAFMQKWSGFLAALLLACIGRSLMSRSFTSDSGFTGRMSIALGPVVLVTGFGGMIFASIRSASVGKLFSNKIMLFYGRISYSFYLWHAFLLGFTWEKLNPYLHYSKYFPFLLFFTTLAIVTPVSYLSWFLLERFYFKKKKYEPTGYHNHASNPV